LSRNPFGGHTERYAKSYKRGLVPSEGEIEGGKGAQILSS